ncbi:glycosyl transferase family 4-domain-containing protein [Cladochytrium replicatum]|nr:glycosyl transferase family 4-domain-containing protein [Cladochytrium replicatum]
MQNPLFVSLILSAGAAVVTRWTILAVKDGFIRKGLHGKDLLKADLPVIAESQGVLVGVVYFITMFLFIPAPFHEWILTHNAMNDTFPYAKVSLPTVLLTAAIEGRRTRRDLFSSRILIWNLAQYLGSLLSLFSMLFLGFADDILDIRWRVKIWFPAFASVPLLMVYFVTYSVTHVIVPPALRDLFGATIIDLGVFYYAYMALLAIFCTNAINIIAGVNGVEGAQSLVIAISIIGYNLVQLTSPNPVMRESHLNSLYFLIPFAGVTIGYLSLNRYPSRVFGGDTYTYFAGMTFAVVGIMGHFSKSLLLFMIPQIFNFVYSCPQLFHFVECPRHRMPQLNRRTGLIEASRAPLLALPATASTFQRLKYNFGRLMLRFLEVLGLAQIRRDPATGAMLDVNNLTLINLVLVKLGPMNEGRVTTSIALIQVACSVAAFATRYPLAKWWYPPS